MTPSFCRTFRQNIDNCHCYVIIIDLRKSYVFGLSFLLDLYKTFHEYIVTIRGLFQPSSYSTVGMFQILLIILQVLLLPRTIIMIFLIVAALSSSRQRTATCNEQGRFSLAHLFPYKVTLAPLY